MELFTTDKLLGSENWARWKWMAEGLLMEKENAYEVCSGEIVKPEPVPDDAQVDVKNKFKSDLANFNKGNRAARGVFSRTLDPSICDLVSMCKTAREIWVKLHELFEQKNTQAQYACQMQFSSFVRDPTNSMAMHIAKLERLISRMSDLDIKPNDFVIMSKLLETLSSDFEPLKMSWCARPEEQQTLMELKKLLVAEEQRRLSESSRETQLTALLAKSNLGKVHSGAAKLDKPVNKQMKQYKCFKCGKRGHVKKDCTAKKNHVHYRKSKEEEVFIGECTVATSDDTWVIDTGATQHITKRNDRFQSFTTYECPIEIRVGNNSTMKAYGHGKISVKMLVHGSWKDSVMENVLYAPDASRNLFSVSQALDHGCKFNMSDDSCEFVKPKGVVAVGIRHGNLFRLLCKVILPKADNAANIVTVSPSEVQLNELNSLQLWHERLGHLNKQHVKKFLHSQGIKVENNNELCEACVLGKQHRLPFQNRQQRAKDVGELIHTDICGPMEEESMGGSRYFLCFTDDYSKYRRVYFLKHKSEVASKFEEFCVFFKNQTQKPIKAVLSDGGLEFNNKDFKGLLKKMGTEFRYSTPYTPQQNGSAERNNRTLVDLARSIMIAKDLPKSLWAEIVNAVVHILNCAGTSAVKGKSPCEVFCGKVPRLDHLRIIGTECFVHIPKQKHKKWDPKGRKGILVGYLDNVDGYRVWFKGTRKIERTREVVFSAESVSTSTIVAIEPEPEQPSTDDIPTPDCTGTEFYPDETPEDMQNDRQLRNRKGLKAPERLIECCIVEQLEPEHYYQAIQSENASEWQAAMDEEMKSLSENETWYLTYLPEGRRAITNRWVYKVKYQANGEIDRFKARLVVKGFSQRKGVDYSETFSPVARFETIRALISVAANENLDLIQFDVKTAFLYGTLDEEIYMTQPEGYDDNSGRVCRLVKSLYGLKQSPRCWNKRFKDFLEGFGLKESSADPCLFCSNNKQQKLLLALHVDDGLVATTPQIKDKFLEELQHEFKVIYKDADYYLGVGIKRLKSGDIAISQEKYADRILERFNMKDANSVSTPMEKCNLSEGDNVEIDSEKIPYRQAVGSLMYMAIATRPDIAFAVSYCSQFLDKAEHKHWALIKRVLKYIKGTINFALVFKSGFQPGVLEAYSDADYASDTTTRKSVSGIVFKYSGGAIDWASRRQQCVSLSTTEAEYVAASEAAKEIVWLKRLFNDIAPLASVPILQVDNASAVRLAKNPEFHQRTKHIDIRYHFVREKCLNGEIEVQHIDGEYQIADILTKALPRKRFELLRAVLGMARMT